ncbi:MAG: 50S ribosomal protein P1 [archaeon]
MEYVYSAMLLHSAKKEINEANVTKVLQAAGAEVESSKVKALVASLKDVNIEEAIKKAAVQPAMMVQAPAHQGGAEAKQAQEPKEDKKTEEEAAEGLGALFG